MKAKPCTVLFMFLALQGSTYNCATTFIRSLGVNHDQTKPTILLLLSDTEIQRTTHGLKTTGAGTSLDSIQRFAHRTNRDSCGKGECSKAGELCREDWSVGCQKIGGKGHEISNEITDREVPSCTRAVGPITQTLRRIREINKTHKREAVREDITQMGSKPALSFRERVLNEPWTCANCVRRARHPLRKRHNADLFASETMPRIELRKTNAAEPAWVALDERADGMSTPRYCEDRYRRFNYQNEMSSARSCNSYSLKARILKSGRATNESMSKEGIECERTCRCERRNETSVRNIQCPAKPLCE
ncbi:hypothetical protein C8R45DRAFT_942287 [Mycena sanguinolenta]|nr:hypothetical protein C8R45DRAFT_942287 [Mycena sanguinolenta]